MFSVDILSPADIRHNPKHDCRRKPDTAYLLPSVSHKDCLYVKTRQFEIETSQRKTVISMTASVNQIQPAYIFLYHIMNVYT